MAMIEHESSVRTLLLIVVVGVAAQMGIGCSVQLGPSKGSVSRAAEIQSLKDEVVRLEGEHARLEGDLQHLQADLSPAELDRQGEIPVANSVSVASGSTVRLADSGPELRLRLRTEDRFNRFVQTTGPVQVSAIAFDAAQLPRSLGDWTIDSTSWRSSLREGFTGTAYALDLPLPGDLDLSAGMEILIWVEILDPRVEESLASEFSIPVTGPLPPRTPA
jgi:hypothetical protein